MMRLAVMTSIVKHSCQLFKLVTTDDHLPEGARLLAGRLNFNRVHL